MDYYIARQPILNRNKKTFAYELLYRGPETAPKESVSGDRATTSLLTSTFITEGIDRISDYKICFINFTKALLLKEVPLNFPNSQIVIEVLEDVPADPEIIKVCKRLKDEGYTIALDDFIYDRSLDPLIELADIIKFDLIQTPLPTILPTLHRLSRLSNLKFLAEKVETAQEFEDALKFDFTYFQGFFFQRPETMKIKELNAVKTNLVQLLAELSRSDWEPESLVEIISRDVSISYKILRYLNSAYFYRLHEITSVKHAITYLGEKELRRFALLIVISEIATEKPSELVRLAMVRAKFCELLAISSQLGEPKSSDLFIVGLFSLLDSMLDTSMEMILAKLPLASNIKDALLDSAGAYAPILSFTRFYEKRRKQECIEALKQFGPVKGKLHDKYLEAIDFSRSLPLN
ncbi:MAG: HDOD domain-containing protein [Desulfobulbaceae bacterium]|nr:MAG: HDOD domain-containing protein [Desulfobulbaceae bacterium]